MHLPTNSMENPPSRIGTWGYTCSKCGSHFDYMTTFMKHRNHRRLGNKFYCKNQLEDYRRDKAQRGLLKRSGPA